VYNGPETVLFFNSIVSWLDAPALCTGVVTENVNGELGRAYRKRERGGQGALKELRFRELSALMRVQGNGRGLFAGPLFLDTKVTLDACVGRTFYSVKYGIVYMSADRVVFFIASNPLLYLKNNDNASTVGSQNRFNKCPLV